MLKNKNLTKQLLRPVSSLLLTGFIIMTLEQTNLHDWIWSYSWKKLEFKWENTYHLTVVPVIYFWYYITKNGWGEPSTHPLQFPCNPYTNITPADSSLQHTPSIWATQLPCWSHTHQNVLRCLIKGAHKIWRHFATQHKGINYLLNYSQKRWCTKWKLTQGVISQYGFRQESLLAGFCILYPVAVKVNYRLHGDDYIRVPVTKYDNSAFCLLSQVHELIAESRGKYSMSSDDASGHLSQTASEWHTVALPSVW